MNEERVIARIPRNASDELLGSMTEHQVEDVTMHTKKDSFKEIVDEVFD